jgi:hypothetical protein
VPQELQRLALNGRGRRRVSAQERVPAVSPPAGVFKGMSGRALRPEVIIWGLAATADAGEPPPCAPTD